MAVWSEAEYADPAAIAQVLPRLGELIGRLSPQSGSRLVVACLDMVKYGADPLPIAEPVIAGFRRALVGCAALVHWWPPQDAVSWGAPPVSRKRRRITFRKFPDPAVDSLHSTYTRLAAALEASAGTRTADTGKAADADKTAVAGTGDGALVDPYAVAVAWHTLDDWALSVGSLLHFREVRAMVLGRSRSGLAREVDAVRRWRGRAVHQVAVMLRVLDNEKLVVLDRRSRRGYELVFGGVGDMLQLHTLLAGTLIGSWDAGFLGGAGPDPLQVAAATTGEPQATMSQYFTLTDCQGSPLWHDGVPADIPVIDGARVVVLDTPPAQRTWTRGRPYRAMVPTLTLDHIMVPAEQGQWWEKVAPPDWRPDSDQLGIGGQ